MDPLLTCRDVARALRLSPGHVRRLVAQRRIPFTKLHGAVRFRPEALERWLQQREVATVDQRLRGRRP